MKLLIATPTFDGSVRHADALVALEKGGPTPLEVATFRPQTSLLAYARNLSLCKSRNDGCSHLLFLDADVQPVEDTWFQVLYDEMQRAGADIIGASIAIKDDSRESSIALAPHGNLFHVERYGIERMAEQEPRTWCDPELLLATGCMLIDLSGEWLNRDVKFTMHDEVARNQYDGMWRARVVPEDYAFVRAASRAGAIIGATQAIKLLHWDGRTAYPNWVE